MRLPRGVWIWTKYSCRWSDQEQHQDIRSYPSSSRDSKLKICLGSSVSSSNLIFKPKNFFIFFVLMTSSSTNGFMHSISQVRVHLRSSIYFDHLARDYDEFRNDTIRNSPIYRNDTDIIEYLEDTPFVSDDLTWRVEKIRLEEQNTNHFLKSGPRFLPYEECRNWVRAWNRWDNEYDWKQWIEEGEKRNSYIPARPDEYYGKRDEWISWAHFLGKVDDSDLNNDVFQ